MKTMNNAKIRFVTAGMSVVSKLREYKDAIASVNMNFWLFDDDLWTTLAILSVVFIPIVAFVIMKGP